MAIHILSFHFCLTGEEDESFTNSKSRNRTEGSRNTCRSAHIATIIPAGRSRNGYYITGRAKRISSLRNVQCSSVKLQPPNQWLLSAEAELERRKTNACLYLVPSLKLGYSMPSFPHTLFDGIKFITEPTFTLLHTSEVSSLGFGRCIPFTPPPRLRSRF